jgi:glycosyltransferase involved in cell wall biosynthesis
MSSNILYVDSYSSIGGGQKSMMAIVANLNRDDYSPIVAFPEGAPLRKIADSKNIPVVEIPLGNSLTEIEDTGKNPIDTLIGFLQLMKTWHLFHRICIQNRIALIHTNSIKATLMVGIPAALLRIPVVWHVRHATNHGVIDRVAALFSRKIVTVSTFVANELSLFVRRQSHKIKRIYNGIDAPDKVMRQTRTDMRREFSMSDNSHLVGIVGRLLDWKGHVTLLEAAPLVLKKSPATVFLIVGEIPFPSYSGYKEHLLALCDKLEIADRVIFTGFREDVSSIISSLDVLVNASENEPLSRVVLEALSLGIPVVATRSGGSPEIIRNRETGMLVTVNDPQALANGILEVIRNPDLARTLSRNGRKLVEQQFNAAAYVKNVESLYESILHARHETSTHVSSQENNEHTTA